MTLKCTNSKCHSSQGVLVPSAVSISFPPGCNKQPMRYDNTFIKQLNFYFNFSSRCKIQLKTVNIQLERNLFLHTWNVMTLSENTAKNRILSYTWQIIKKRVFNKSMKKQQH